MGENGSGTITVPRWLAALAAFAVVLVLILDSISAILWTPAQVRALLAWREEMPDPDDLEELERRIRVLETELRISHERYIDLLNRRSAD